MKNVLIVDDNKANLASARSVLSGIYKVIPVVSGAQALKYLSGNHCDMILLDINMPEMNGFEVMEKIQSNESWKSIPVVFLTADSEAETETKCFEVGAMDFIAKPFVPAVMLSRIGRIFELEDMRKRLSDMLELTIQKVSDMNCQSCTDALTGLWNRAYTESTVNEMVSMGSSGSLLMIDMDNFKSINDTYGHMEGDNTLKMFAQTMRKFASDDDVLCRIGGDEFVMFVKDKTNPKEIGSIAQHIINDLCEWLKFKNFTTNSSVSIGIAQIPDDADDFSAAYNAADKALYFVKQNGKSSYHFFDDRKNEDMKYLCEITSANDPGKGAYQLDPQNFNHVYNFIQRFKERNKCEVQTVIFNVEATINGMSKEDMEVAIEAFERAVFESLRRTDVSTRYSDMQLAVVLMDTNEENVALVANRIIGNFEKIYGGDGIKIDYEINKLK